MEEEAAYEKQPPRIEDDYVPLLADTLVTLLTTHDPEPPFVTENEDTFDNPISDGRMRTTSGLSLVGESRVGATQLVGETVHLLKVIYELNLFRINKSIGIWDLYLLKF